jgi:hypothetical protein
MLIKTFQFYGGRSPPQGPLQGTLSPVIPLAYGTGVNPCKTPAYGTGVNPCKTPAYDTGGLRGVLPHVQC